MRLGMGIVKVLTVLLLLSILLIDPVLTVFYRYFLLFIYIYIHIYIHAYIHTLYMYEIYHSMIDSSLINMALYSEMVK